MNTPEVKMSEPCYLVSHRRVSEGVLQTHVAITPTLETPEPAHTVKEPVTLHDSGDHHDGLTGCQLLRQVGLLPVSSRPLSSDTSSFMIILSIYTRQIIDIFGLIT